MEEKTRRKFNRLSGLSMMVFGGIIASAGSPLLITGGGIFLSEGIGDLISGDHHYVSSRVVKLVTRGKVNITYEGNRYAK